MSWSGVYIRVRARGYFRLPSASLHCHFNGCFFFLFFVIVLAVITPSKSVQLLADVSCIVFWTRLNIHVQHTRIYECIYRTKTTATVDEETAEIAAVAEKKTVQLNWKVLKQLIKSRLQGKKTKGSETLSIKNEPLSRSSHHSDGLFFDGKISVTPLLLLLLPRHLFSPNDVQFLSFLTRHIPLNG